MRKTDIRVTTCVIILIPLILLPVVGRGGAELKAGPGAQEPLMRVYLIPFDTSTYVAISMSNIGEGTPYDISFVDPGPGTRQRRHPFISRLHRQLQSDPALGRKINDAAIRLRVDLGGQTFFADEGGVVLEKVSGKTFRLSKAQRREIEREIIYFSGVVDINAGKKLVLFPD